MKLLHFLTLTMLLALPAFGQTTAFTYQGRLNDGGSPASGIYDLRFAIYDAAGGGTQQGGTLTSTATPVTNGLFTVTLDFGNQFPGADRWLVIGVRTNGVGGFSTLTPRQPITPSPYAIHAGNVTAAGIAGTIPSAALGGTYGNAVNFTSAGNSFAGSGTGLTNVNAVTLGGLNSSNFWRTSGNSGTTSGSHFLGTTDNQPLEFKANNRRLLRLEPNTNHAPNVVAGDPLNSMSGAIGSTIAGGGGRNRFDFMLANTVAADFSTIGGGGNNQIAPGGHYSTIGGGYGNTIQTNAEYARLGGGFFNTIQNGATEASLGGGGENTIQTNAAYATIPGGHLNSATNYAFAAGRRAKANHAGAFVWADSQNADFASTADNQFNVRAAGGLRFIAGGAGMTVDGLSVLAGTVPTGGLAGTYSNAVAFTSAGNSFSGNGSGLTSLNASQLTSGTMADARLSSNVALKNQNNAFSASQSVPGGSASSPGLSFSGDTDTGWFASAANTLAVTTGGAERMRINASGVAIGETSPEGQLHITGGPSTPQIKIETTSTDSFVKLRLESFGKPYWDFAVGGSANVMNWYFSGTAQNLMTLSTNGHLRVNDALGVGADSPDAHLTVAGNSSKPQLRLQQTTAGAAPRLRMINGISPYWDMLTASNGDYIRWYSEKSGFNAMTLEFDGTLTTVGPVNPPSDRNVKQDFAAVDAMAVLEKVAALPIQSWAYKNSPDTRHIGPVAQDFHAAFQFNGDDDKHIATVDADGVALAAIQGLNQKLSEELKQKQTEISKLEQRLEKLERLVNRKLHGSVQSTP